MNKIHYGIDHLLPCYISIKNIGNGRIIEFLNLLIQVTPSKLSNSLKKLKSNPYLFKSDYLYLGEERCNLFDFISQKESLWGLEDIRHFIFTNEMKDEITLTEIISMI